MDLREAYRIADAIDTTEYTAKERIEAARVIAESPTHNGITKDELCKIIYFLVGELDNVREVPHGHWKRIRIIENFCIQATCSRCEGRVTMNIPVLDLFCRCCSAKMDEVTADD